MYVCTLLFLVFLGKSKKKKALHEAIDLCSSSAICINEGRIYVDMTEDFFCPFRLLFLLSLIGQVVNSLEG